MSNISQKCFTFKHTITIIKETRKTEVECNPASGTRVITARSDTNEFSVNYPPPKGSGLATAQS